MTDQQAKALDIFVRALDIQDQKRDTPINVALQTAIAESRGNLPEDDQARASLVLLSLLHRLRSGELRIHRVDVSRDKIETTDVGPYRTFEPARTSMVTFYVEERP